MEKQVAVRTEDGKQVEEDGKQVIVRTEDGKQVTEHKMANSSQLEQKMAKLVTVRTEYGKTGYS